MHGELNILELLWNAGIVVKLVLVILIACSVLSWAIIFQKRKVFNVIAEENQSFVNFFYQSTNLVEINEQAEFFKNSTVGLMFIQGFTELRKIREKLQEVGKDEGLRSYLDDHGMIALERSLKKGASTAGQSLDLRLSTLASIGSITPFIGLFGTVWGIIGSFTGLASGGGSIEAVAPGIAEALVATAIGLFAAIPAVWAFNVFNSKASEFQGQMEVFGQDFLNLIERSVLISKE